MYVGAGWSETGNKNTKPGVWRALGAGALFAVAAFCLANAVQSTLHDGASSAGALLRLSSAPPRAQTKGTGTPLDLAASAQSLDYTPERNVSRRGVLAMLLSSRTMMFMMLRLLDIPSVRACVCMLVCAATSQYVCAQAPMFVCLSVCLQCMADLSLTSH